LLKRPAVTSELFTESRLRVGKNPGTLPESDWQVGLWGNRHNMLFLWKHRTGRSRGEQNWL